MRALRTLYAAVPMSVLLGGCAFMHDNVRDPGTLVPVASVLKSLRCEAITYLVANRLRQKEFKNLVQHDFTAAFDKYASLDLDDKEYGTIEADLKTIDSLGLSLGMDWKTNVAKNGSSHDWHIGPSVTATKTYVRSDVFALPQDAELGPRTGKKGDLPQFYGDVDRSDAGYFCYTAKKGTSDSLIAIDVAEMLARDELPQFDNYERILVDGHLPLARWLEIKGSEMVKNSVAKGPYLETLLPAQLNYSFALELKPSFDFKYTMVATVINPQVPDVTASIDSTSTFFIYLNTEYAKAAYGAKSGGADIPREQAGITWGPKSPAEQAAAEKEISLHGKHISPPISPTRRPGVGLTAPMALPAPTNQ